MSYDRRDFVLKLIPLAGAAVMLPRVAQAVELPELTETDAMAKALGFKLNTSAVDQAKYRNHTKEQTCGNCLHYAKPDAERARCDIFIKTVPKQGWCSAYVKRA